MKVLKVNYFSRNSWGYKIWNAVNTAESRNINYKLPDHFRKQLGDKMLSISYRIDSMPFIFNRINENIKKIYKLVKSRDKSKDDYAFQGIPPEIVLGLLIDINSFIYELRSCCEISEKLIKQIIRHYKKYSPNISNKELPEIWINNGWYAKLREFRREIFHASAPYIDIDISKEPKYDLLFPLENIHDYSKSDRYFRLSDLQEIRKGFYEGMTQLQDFVIEKINHLN